MIYPIIGPPATGKAFFDRKKERRELREALETGSILLLGPRRFGKTSLMLDLRDNPENGWSIFFIDAEWINDPAQFVTDILLKIAESASLFKRFQKLAKTTLKGIYEIFKQFAKKKIGIEEARTQLMTESKNDWVIKGRAIFKTVNDILNNDEKMVFIIDEFPWMVQRILENRGGVETRQFLSWLRMMRQIPDGFKNIRFLIGGSIGVEHVLKKAKAVSTVNDLRTVLLDGFPEEKARELIKKLFENTRVRADNSLVDAILKTIGTPAHPFFLQLLVSSLVNEARDRDDGETITAKDVEKVYRSRILGPECKIYFEHYYQRIIDYYSPVEAESAKRILGNLCEYNEMTRDEVFGIFRQVSQENDSDSKELFETLMDTLLNDFYIAYRRESRIYRFKHKILQDWWRTHHPVMMFE